MAERVRQMMKNSSSKISVSKGSVNHVGTTPYRFRIDLFVSYAENVKSLSEACITWERRGKVEATKAVSVVDGKAVFRQQLTMECTLFRKNPGKSSSKHESTAQEEMLNFDEKKAKLYLRKGSSQGKAVAKLALNLSDYIKGATSTVFADMKLSDGTNVVTKVEATMIALDKKKKFGSSRGSAMSDNTSVDDSLCGDDDDLDNVQRLSDIPQTPIYPSSRNAFTSPVSSSSVTNTPPNGAASTSSFIKNKSIGTSGSDPLQHRTTTIPASTSVSFSELPMSSTKSTDRLFKKTKSVKSRVKDSDMVKESPSLKDKIKNKLKKSVSRKDKERSEKSETADKHERHGSKDSISIRPERLDMNEYEHKRSDSSVQFDMTSPVASSMPVASPNHSELAEVKELKMQIEALKKENHKLKKAKLAAVEEMEALRSDLEAYEEQLASIERKEKPKSASDAKISKLQAKLKEKEKKIEELKSQKESLMEEMEEQHIEMRSVSKRLDDSDRQRLKDDLAKSEKAREDLELLEKIRHEQAQLDKSRVELQRQQDLQRQQEQQKQQELHMQQERQLRQTDSRINDDDSIEVIALKKRIDDLEVALEREPTFMDVVNELKVMKMTVALANMEKEEALFELQTMRQQLRAQEFRQLESDDF